MNFNFLILAIGAESALIGDVGRDIGRNDTLKTFLVDEGPRLGGLRTHRQGFHGIIPSVQDDIGAMFKVSYLVATEYKKELATWTQSGSTNTRWCSRLEFTRMELGSLDRRSLERDR